MKWGWHKQSCIDNASSMRVAALSCHCYTLTVLQNIALSWSGMSSSNGSFKEERRDREVTLRDKEMEIGSHKVHWLRVREIYMQEHAIVGLLCCSGQGEHAKEVQACARLQAA
eukprot:3572873-Amphidinium_carterae.1